MGWAFNTFDVVCLIVKRYSREKEKERERKRKMYVPNRERNAQNILAVRTELI